MKRFLGFVGVLGVLVLVGANLAFCGTVTVSGTTTVFTTIQAGINACSEGGTVSVAAGTYNEAVYINKGITLVGAGSNSTTITTAGISNRSTVRFNGTATNNASISGFTITGATGDYPNGCGIACSYGSPTITNNTISGNSSYGIFCYYSSPTITNNTISESSTGIYCYYSSSPTITNNTISGNSSYGIYCYSSSPTITNNTISGNSYGIFCYSSSPTITNNTISGNSSNGIYCYYSSSPSIYNNIITENATTSTSYYGIYIASGNPIIDYNNVWGNGLGGNNNYYGWSAGPNDISTNPQFIGGGDYHLQATSPCINAGSNTAKNIPQTDKDGNPRIAGGIVDMGAYEYQGPPPIQYGTLSITSTPSGAKIYLNSINTGSVTTNVFTNISSGTHTVKLTLPGYQDWYGTATVTAGVITTVYAALQGVPALQMIPATQTITLGQEFSMSLEVKDVTDLYGGSIEIVFNPSLISAIRATEGSFLNKDGTDTSFMRVIDNVNGRILIGITRLGQVLGVSGSGTLCNVIFKAKADGTGTLRFENISLRDSNLVNISTIIGVGEVKINSPRIQITPISGIIGTIVTIAGENFGSTEAVKIDFGTTPSIIIAMTNISGSFSTTFTVDTQSAGTKTIIATGISSGRIATVIFVLQPIPIFNLVYVNNTTGNDSYNGSSIAVSVFPVGPKRTIQAGINACPTGGTVSVAAGTYTEAVYINKGIALIGAGSNSTTITTAGISNTSTVSFDGTATNSASISGFTICGATYNWPNSSGIFCSNGSPTITNNTISGNGAGICCESSSPTITNNTISRNSNYGIYCYSSSPTITNNIILGDDSVGIFCELFSLPTITNNIISRNDEGIICYPSSLPTITNNIISENNNVGISCYDSPTISNNIISGNGWGISCYTDSSPTITNNTILGNSADGISCESSSSPSIYNNIITENGTTSHYSYGIRVLSGSPFMDYNNVWGNGLDGNNNYYGCSAGPKDISANPQFLGGGDYHLQSTSPCINTGSNTAKNVPSTDKDGNPRIVNGTVDMGAYEYQGTPIAAYISILPTAGTVGTIVTISGNGFGASELIKIDFGTTQTILLTSTGVQGSFTTTFTVNTQPYGATSIIVSGLETGLRVLASFEIVPKIISVLPLSGQIGGVITVTGNGFGAIESIKISLGNTPTIAIGTTTANGEFQMIFATNSQPIGTTTIVAYGLTTNTNARAYFVILPPTILKITPATRNIAVGSTFTCQVKIEDVKQLIGAGVYLDFNPSILEVVEIGTGTFPSAGMILRNKYDNSTGQINYAVGLLTGSATGSGVICSIKFRAKASGTSSVIFDSDKLNNCNTILINADSQEIPFARQEAIYQVIAGIEIYPKGTETSVGKTIAYTCFASCGSSMIDVTGSTTFTSNGGGSWTVNSFLAKQIGTYTIQGSYLGL